MPHFHTVESVSAVLWGELCLFTHSSPCSKSSLLRAPPAQPAAAPCRHTVMLGEIHHQRAEMVLVLMVLPWWPCFHTVATLVTDFSASSFHSGTVQ